MAELKIYGSRGSYGTDFPQCRGFGNSNTCVGLWLDKEVIFFDAGSGMPLAQKDIDKLEPDAVTIALTHYHADHVSGILGTGQAFFNPRGVGTNLIGPYGLSRGLMRNLEGLNSPGNFSMYKNLNSLTQVPPGQRYRTTEGTEVRSFTAGWHPNDHRFKEGDLCFDFFRDHGVVAYTVDVEGMLVAVTSDQEFRFSRGEDNVVKPVVNVNERRDAFIGKVFGAQVLYADGQFTEREYTGDFGLDVRGYGHASMEEMVEMAKAARVKLLVLGHHKPGRSDTELESLERKLQRENPGQDLVFARQGMKVDLESLNLSQVA